MLKLLRENVDTFYVKYGCANAHMTSRTLPGLACRRSFMRALSRMLPDHAHATPHSQERYDKLRLMRYSSPRER